MKVFYAEAIREWVEDGNLAEEFETKGPKLVIILDNASFHKKAEIIKQIEEEMPKIQLEYLPAYSPDYNLIELVWHSAKEYLAHRLFKSVEELEMVLHNLLNPRFAGSKELFNNFKILTGQGTCKILSYSRACTKTKKRLVVTLNQESIFLLMTNIFFLLDEKINSRANYFYPKSLQSLFK